MRLPTLSKSIWIGVFLGSYLVFRAPIALTGDKFKISQQEQELKENKEVLIKNILEEETSKSTNTNTNTNTNTSTIDGKEGVKKTISESTIISENRENRSSPKIEIKNDQNTEKKDKNLIRKMSSRMLPKIDQNEKKLKEQNKSSEDKDLIFEDHLIKKKEGGLTRTKSFREKVNSKIITSKQQIRPETDIMESTKSLPARIDLIIDQNLSEKLRRNGITWYDLMDYAKRNGHSIKVSGHPDYMRDDLEEESRNSYFEKTRTHSARTNSSSRNSDEKCPSSQKLECIGDAALQDIQNISNKVKSETIHEKGKKSDKEPASITHDDALMYDLLCYADQMKKNLDLDHLKEVVFQGETLVKSIYKGEKPEIKQEDAMVAIMWYLTALNGQKVLLNPETWKVERGFVEGGTFTFQDEGNKIFNYLSGFKTNTRNSTHYGNENALGKKKKKLLLFNYETDEKVEQRGFTVPSKYTGTPFPGKIDTRTVLFGSLQDGRTFMKAETQPFDPFNPKELGATVEHSLHWIEHSQKERSGVARMESHSHRETTHQLIKDAFEEYINQVSKLKQSAKNSEAKTKELKLEDDKTQGIHFGIDKMIEVLVRHKNEGIENIKGNHLLEMLYDYREKFCLGESHLVYKNLKGCEALVTFPRPEL